MKQEKSKRLKEAIRYLKSQGLFETQADIAEAMQALPQTLSAAANGNEKYVTDNFLYRFNEASKRLFNLNWLIDGIGDMLCSNVKSEDVFCAPVQNNADNSSGNIQISNSPNSSINSMLENRESVIRELRKQIDDKNEEIKFLRDLLMKTRL